MGFYFIPQHHIRNFPSQQLFSEIEIFLFISRVLKLTSNWPSNTFVIFSTLHWLKNKTKLINIVSRSQVMRLVLKISPIALKKRKSCIVLFIYSNIYLIYILCAFILYLIHISLYLFIYTFASFSNLPRPFW